MTVTEDYGDWRVIQGVQLWGEARLLSGVERAKAIALYLTKFPFVRDILKEPRLTGLMVGMGVYRVVPRKVAYTDNTTGVLRPRSPGIGLGRGMTVCAAGLWETARRGRHLPNVPRARRRCSCEREHFPGFLLGRLSWIGFLPPI